MEINRYLDHAVLKPDLTISEVKAAIQLGIDFEVATVCVRPCDIELAKEMCKGTKTQVSCVLDFPHGVGGAAAKEAMAALYVAQGVVDIDMVMNHSYARSGEWDVVEDEIRRVVKQAHAKGVNVKVIFESGLFTISEVKKGVEVCIAAGADYVKTSTGFSGIGATVEAVQAMLDTAKGRIKVKPSQGIRDYETAKMYVDMGVARLGVGYTSTPVICGKKAQQNSEQY